MLSVVDSQALVLPANEDGADDVTNNENTQANVVCMRVVEVVQDGEANETDCANNGKDSGQRRVDLLPKRRVPCKRTRMAKVALEDEGKVEGDYGNSRHGNEQGLQGLRANVRDVGYCLAYSDLLASDHQNSRLEQAHIPSVIVG